VLVVGLDAGEASSGPLFRPVPALGVVPSVPERLRGTLHRQANRAVEGLTLPILSHRSIVGGVDVSHAEVLPVLVDEHDERREVGLGLVDLDNDPLVVLPLGQELVEGRGAVKRSEFDVGELLEEDDLATLLAVTQHAVEHLLLVLDSSNANQVRT